MGSPAGVLNPSEAARRLGVSTKALRLYERRGLVAPLRTGVGWRVYGVAEMARAAEVVALRALSLGLDEIALILGGDAGGLETVLAAHQARLDAKALDLADTIAKVRRLRGDLARGDVLPSAAAQALEATAAMSLAFDLPWPWDGEPFELRDIQPLTFIIGPLGSGKTRLARRVADTIPGAAFLGLDRLDDDAAVRARLDADQTLAARVGKAVAGLVDDGATTSCALVALVAGLEDEAPAAFVVDMIEQGLDRPTQQALIGSLRRRDLGARPLVLLTRSNAILDLDAVGPSETIILCPANHSPPFRVLPHADARGFETVATCLASPAVRARTEGVIAWRPEAA